LGRRLKAQAATILLKHLCQKLTYD